MTNDSSSEPRDPQPGVTTPGGQTGDPHDPHDLRAAPLDGPGARGWGKWRWGLRLGGGLALLALLAVVAVAVSPLIPRPPRPAPPPPASLAAITLKVPGAAGYSYSNAAWSPDGRSIALVRDSVGDPRATSDPNDFTALVFDSQTGALLQGFPFDHMLIPGGALPDTQVVFGGLTWAPDGVQIAAQFLLLQDDASGNQSPAASGVALLTVRGAYLGELAVARDRPLPNAIASPFSFSSPQQVAVWDTQPGQMAARFTTVAPAYAYRWRTDGALQPLPRASQSGDVDMWRDGQLQYVNALVCGEGSGDKLLARPYVALTLSTLAWSPGGLYLTGLSVTGRYAVPTSAMPTPSPGEVPAVCGAGPLGDSILPAPTPDAGLVNAITLAASPQNAFVALAWRPDRQRLAAFPYDITGAGSILIYDCHTGLLVKRITAGQAPISGQPGTGPAKNFDIVFTGGVWSPDGRSLLVEASGSGATPFILRPAALGN